MVKSDDFGILLLSGSLQYLLANIILIVLAVIFVYILSDVRVESQSVFICVYLRLKSFSWRP